MSASSKLKPIERRMQFITAIEKAAPFGGDVWQTTDRGREIIQITFIENDPVTNKLILYTTGAAPLSSKFPIFIRLSYRNLIFYISPVDYQIEDDKIHCNYPKEARALETRTSDRYVLPAKSDISLGLKKIEKFMRENPLDLEVRIVDVSEKGFGILISKMNKDFLKQDDHFWIKSIDHKNLDRYIFGTVTYVAPKGYYLKHGSVRVGLSLDTPLSHEMFEYLKKKCILILSP